MNKIKIISLIGVAALLATTTPAQEISKIESGSADSTDWYSGKDWRIDLGAVYRAPEPFKKGSLHENDADWGASLGFKTFFTEHFGIGADTYLVADRPHDHDVGRSLFETVDVHGIARLPMGRLAPYVLGGIGRDFNYGEYTCHAAVGLEYRFADNFGLFAEGRYSWSNSHRKEEDNGQARIGVRLWGQR